MIDVGEALKKLSSVHRKYRIPGGFDSLDRLKGLWPKHLPCSVELENYYSSYDPKGVKIETGLTPIKFFGVNDLDKAQLGYRWSGVGEFTQLNHDWPEDYLVIMDDNGGGKPIIAVTGLKDTPIFASYDVVRPFEISPNFAAFMCALTILIELVYGEFNIFDVLDDDGVSEDFLFKLSSMISPILGREDTERFVEYFYG